MLAASGVKDLFAGHFLFVPQAVSSVMDPRVSWR